MIHQFTLFALNFDYFVLNIGIENIIQTKNYSKKFFSKKQKGS